MNASFLSAGFVVQRTISPARLLLAAAIVLHVAAPAAFASSSNSDPFLITRQGAGGDNYTSATTGTDFGTINSGTTWLLEGGELTTFSDGGDSKLGANLWYSVYRNSQSRPAFTSENLPFNSNPSFGSDKWQSSGLGLNLTGPTVQILGANYNGTYNMDYYFQARFNWGSQYNRSGSSTDTSPPTSNFYTATYTLAGFDYYLDGSSGTTTQSTVTGGAATLTGSVGIGKFGGGTTQLTATGNNYTGRTLVAAGTLQTTAAGVVPDGSDVILKLDTVFDLNGNNETVASVREYGSNDGGTVTLGSGTLTVNGSNKGNISQNSITGDGGNVTFSSDGTIYYLYGTQGYTGTTTVTAGTVQTSVSMSSAAFQIEGGTFETLGAEQIGNSATMTINGGQLTLGGNEAIGGLSGTGGTVSLSDKTLTTSSDSSTTYSGAISGTGGGLTKSGGGKLTLSGENANTYTGLTTVSGGTLELKKTAGVNAIAGATTINSGAILLLSASDQVDSGATDVVTLSGGTIKRASGMSEVFGDLDVTAASFLDYSGGTAGSLTFTGLDYTPSSTLKLELQNFTQGSALVIQNTSNWASEINTGFTFTGSGGFGSSSFVDNGEGIGTFTITAIPEPSTYVAAAGLLAMFLWPVRRRLVKDVKSILGMRPTGRDRIEAYRKA